MMFFFYNFSITIINNFDLHFQMKLKYTSYYSWRRPSNHLISLLPSFSIYLTPLLALLFVISLILWSSISCMHFRSFLFTLLPSFSHLLHPSVQSLSLLSSVEFTFYSQFFSASFHFFITVNYFTFRPSPYYSIFRSPSLSRPTLSLLPSLSVPPSLSFFLSFSPYTSLPLSFSPSLSPSLPLWSGEWGERPCSIQSAWELSQWRGHEDKLHRLPRSCHVQVRTTILASQSLCILSIVKWRFCIAFSPPSLILVPFLLFFPLLPSSSILLSCFALTFLLHLSAPLRTFFQYSSIFFSSLLPAILLSSLNYSPLISLLFSSLPWLFLSFLTSSLHVIGGLLLTRNVSSSPSRH